MRTVKSLCGTARLVGAAWALVIAVSVFTGQAHAHGDEDHGEQQPAATTAAAPRVEAHSELFEIVGIPSSRDGGKLHVYLHDYWSNAKVDGAQLELTAGDSTSKGVAVKNGYEFPAPWVTKPGQYDVTFSIVAGDQSDLLIGRLDIPAAPAEARSHESVWDHIIPHDLHINVPTWVVGGLLALALVAAIGALRAPSPFRRPLLVLAATAGISTAAIAAVKLAVDDLGEGVAMAALPDVADVSRRLANGNVFVPKVTQRLLEVKTAQATKSEQVRKTVRLIGQVIPNPNSSGLMQALLAGRIEPPPEGFPAIGASVKKGAILGYLTPRVEVVDQSDIRQTQGDLDRQIDLAEAKLRRIEPLETSGAVPKGQIIDARIELESLRKRRASIKPVLAEREELTAPVDGVISQANVTSGQVVEAQALLFQIVNPNDLWVEALAFDATSAKDVEKARKEAFASTADGRKVPLAFSGRGLTLRQQAVPLQFKITGDGSSLNVGEPVTVFAPLSEEVSAITLPRAAVVRSSNGQSVVWAHQQAETFEPRVVQTVPVDAERVGVAAGVEPDTRVVVRGAELINQVR